MAPPHGADPPESSLDNVQLDDGKCFYMLMILYTMVQIFLRLIAVVFFLFVWVIVLLFKCAYYLVDGAFHYVVNNFNLNTLYSLMQHTFLSILLWILKVNKTQISITSKRTFRVYKWMVYFGISCSIYILSSFFRLLQLFHSCGMDPWTWPQDDITQFNESLNSNLYIFFYFFVIFYPIPTEHPLLDLQYRRKMILNNHSTSNWSIPSLPSFTHFTSRFQSKPVSTEEVSDVSNTLTAKDNMSPRGHNDSYNENNKNTTGKRKSKNHKKNKENNSSSHNNHNNINSHTKHNDNNHNNNNHNSNNNNNPKKSTKPDDTNISQTLSTNTNHIELSLLKLNNDTPISPQNDENSLNPDELCKLESINVNMNNDPNNINTLNIISQIEADDTLTTTQTCDLSDTNIPSNLHVDPSMTPDPFVLGSNEQSGPNNDQNTMLILHLQSEMLELKNELKTAYSVIESLKSDMLLSQHTNEQSNKALLDLKRSIVKQNDFMEGQQKAIIASLETKFSEMMTAITAIPVNNNIPVSNISHSSVNGQNQYPIQYDMMPGSPYDHSLMNIGIPQQSQQQNQQQQIGMPQPVLCIQPQQHFYRNDMHEYMYAPPTL